MATSGDSARYSHKQALTDGGENSRLIVLPLTTSQSRGSLSSTQCACALPEIVSSVLDHCWALCFDDKELAELALVSKVFNAAVTPLLYGSTGFKLERTSSDRPLQPETEALLATLTSRPSLGIFVQAATVEFASQTEEQALSFLRCLPNLRFLDLHIIDVTPAIGDVKLLDNLHDLEALRLSSVDPLAARLSADFLQHFLGKPKHIFRLDITYLHCKLVGPYASFLGAGISQLNLSIVTGDALQQMWQTILPALTSLTGLRAGYGVTRTIAPLVVRTGLGSLADLEYLQLDLEDEALVEGLQMLADPAIWPHLRATPTFCDRAVPFVNWPHTPPPSFESKNGREQLIRLYKAALKGLEKRRFWSLDA